MSASSHSELILELARLQTRIQKQLSGPFSQHGISFTDFLVLKELNAAPGKKMRRIDLAQQVGLTASGVTRLLNPLEKIGLIKKEEAPRDARVSLVALTRTGETIFNEANVSFRQMSAVLLEPLGSADQKSLLKLVARLL